MSKLESIKTLSLVKELFEKNNFKYADDISIFKEGKHTTMDEGELLVHNIEKLFYKIMEDKETIKMKDATEKSALARCKDLKEIIIAGISRDTRNN